MDTKKVEKMDGYTATAPRYEFLFTVMVMRVDGTVTEFTDLYPVQVHILTHAFEADDSVIKYVVKEW